MSKPTYDSTVARIAGNLLSGMPANVTYTGDGFDVRVNSFELTPHNKAAAGWAVAMAREIVAEVKRTEPQEDREP